MNTRSAKAHTGHRVNLGAWSTCLLVGALCLGTLPAQASATQGALSKSSDTPMTAAQQVKVRVDREIAADVGAMLADRDNIRVTALTVDVDAGIVTLGGLVATSAEKHLTARYVNDVDGVQGVVNAIVVNPGLD